MVKHLFQDFEVERPPAGGRASDLPSDASGSSKPSSGATYDAGYASGWDDATRAAEERGERISAELERTIQDLGFSYHEALDQLRGQFLDALSGFLDALLPSALPQVFRAQLESTLAEQTDQNPEIEIVLSAEQVPLFQALLPPDLTSTVSLVPEDTLAADQAYIRLDQRECLIDIRPMVEALKAQLQALSQPTEEVRHAG